MNREIIRYILGHVLRLFAFILLMPAFIGLIYWEKEGIYYLVTAVLSFLMSVAVVHKKPKNTTFYLKEGCVTTALSWIVMSVVGCLPMWMSGEIGNFTDALFETISGFTTTGASIIDDVEALSHCTLLWRSFTHWIGGMGVLVFLLAIIPLSGGSNINLMRAESPGPSVGKLVPKIKYTARILYMIYFGLTILETVLLLFGGMTVFDAVCTTFATAGTGGFGIRNDSIGSFSPYIKWVITIFMLLFGVNFNGYYLLLFRQFKKFLEMEEIRWYFIIVTVASVMICIDLCMHSQPFPSAFMDASFQVASIITTTGFATVDFNLWSGFSRTLLVILMFVGACAGSTGGGIKVSRFIVLFKTVFKEMGSYIHPKSIKKIKIDGKTVEHDVVRSINVYMVTVMVIFVISLMFISLEGKDLVTNFTAIATTINNVGPGLDLIGPTHNFGDFSAFSKYVLMFDMLAGRLELFPLLILFHPAIWKDFFDRKKTK